MPSLRSGRSTRPRTEPSAHSHSIPTENRFAVLDPDTDTYDFPTTDADRSEGSPPPSSDRPPPTSRDSPPRCPSPDELTVFCTVVDPSCRLALAGLGPVGRANAIRSLVGPVRELRLLHSGALRVSALSLDQVSTLLCTTSLSDIHVHFSPPRHRLQGSLGVISCIDPSVPDSDLAPLLAEFGVHDFCRLKRRSRDGRLHDTWSVKATFPSALPPYVLLNFERCPVRSFVRRPLQCFRCYRFGHGVATCRFPLRCGSCGGPHETADCSASVLCCPSCSDSHVAWSSECPVRRRAWRIEGLRASGLTYSQASAAVSLAPLSDPLPPRPPVLSRSSPSPLPSPTPRSPTCDVACSATPTPSTDADTQTCEDLCIIINNPVEPFHHQDGQVDETIVFTRAALAEFLASAIELLRSIAKRGPMPSYLDLASLTLKDFFLTDSDSD